MIDWKQRISTILSFLGDKFALKDIPLICYDDGTEDDYNGLICSQLPEDVRKSIEAYDLSFIIFGEGTTQEVNGKSPAPV